MGRGLSELQKNILEALPRWAANRVKAPTRVALVEVLGLPPTAANRVAVSRAVSRLLDRGLVLPVRRGDRKRAGYARATPQQVKTWTAMQEAQDARGVTT